MTGASYAYRHALLRDAGYASLARAERARLHVAMARWLAEIAGPQADLVAEGIGEHLANALDSLSAFAAPDLPDRDTLARDAATWHERAAEAAVRLAAVDAARRLLRRAVELTPVDDAHQAALRRLRLGEVLAQGAKLDQGVTEIEAARATFASDPTAAEPYERATYALGRAHMQQIRFPEAIALTEEGIAHLGDAADPLRARLHALHAWSRGASGLTDGVADEADAALAAVRAGGDPERELDVLEHWCAARDELDVASEDDWAQLEDGARRLGRWHQVVVAARVRAMHRSFSDPARALAPLEATAELASVHGLTEQAGWADYARCETLWVLGRWDEALTVGGRALDLAERNAYGRLAFRTFMILLPIAAVRGDGALADRWDAWWAVAEAQFPPNPSAYGRMLRGAYLVWLSLARGEAVVAPADDLVDAVIPMINPHFLAATETVVRAWLDAGRTDLARAATDRLVEVGVGDHIPPLMDVSMDLLRGWLGDADAAARAVVGARAAAAAAPWWEARALRSVGDVAGAEELERRLR